MTRLEIEKNMKFRQECSKYGLNWEYFNVVTCGNNDYVILLNMPNRNIYVLLDKNYNTIGVEPFNSHRDYNALERFARDKYNAYCNFTDKMPFGENFGYPFEKFTLKQIIDLANRIEVMETNHGHSLCIKVNGELYHRNSEKDETYFQLLLYIKFLGEEIKQYFLYRYHMQMLGCEDLDVYTYVRHLIKCLNECINSNINKYRRTYSGNILSYIGQNYGELKFNGILDHVANLLIKDKGYKSKANRPGEIEPIEIPENKQDLSILSMKLLKILDLSDKDLKMKEEIRWQQSLDKDLTNLRIYIEEDIDDNMVEEKIPIKKNIKKDGFKH